MQSTVINGNFNPVYQTQEDLYNDIEELIKKYSGNLSIAQFIGVLEIAKFELLSEDNNQ